MLSQCARVAADSMQLFQNRIVNFLDDYWILFERFNFMIHGLMRSLFQIKPGTALVGVLAFGGFTSLAIWDVLQFPGLTAYDFINSDRALMVPICVLIVASPLCFMIQRYRFQLHLSTALILMFATSAILLRNTQWYPYYMYNNDFQYPNCVAYGWPCPTVVFLRDSRLEPFKHVVVWVGIVVDLLICESVIALAIGFDWWRGRQKSPAAC